MFRTVPAVEITQLVREVAAERPHVFSLTPAKDALQWHRVSERDVLAVLTLLADQNPDVRYEAACVLDRAINQRGKRQMVPHLPALLPLLADPDEDVRREVRHMVQSIGERALSMLRELSRTPGPHRRHALLGLAEVVGWFGLDPADQSLIQRLIRIKIPRETPEPFVPDGHWYALPTGDQAAVLDALGLSDPMPVTMRLGRAAASDSDHYLMGGRVAYVTPVLDGWTLVFMWENDHEDRVVALSRRFGTAHWYTHWDDYHGGGTRDAWYIAEHGTMVRSYCRQGNWWSEEGDPLPAEQGHLLPHLTRNAHLDTTCDAMTIAAHISVDPTAIGPHTRVAGHPVMALTLPGREKGIYPGAFPI